MGRVSRSILCLVAAALPVTTAMAQAQAQARPCPGPRYGDDLERRAEQCRVEVERHLAWGQHGLTERPLTVDGRLAPLPWFQFDAAGALWLQAHTTVLRLDAGAERAVALHLGRGDRLVGAVRQAPLVLGDDEIRRPMLWQLEPGKPDGGARRARFAELHPQRALVSPSGELGVLVPAHRTAFVDLLAGIELGSSADTAVRTAIWNDRETAVAMVLHRPTEERGKPIGIRIADPAGGVRVRIPVTAAARAVDFAPDGKVLYWSDRQAHRTELATGRSLLNHAVPQQFWLTVDDAVAIAHDGASLTTFVAERMQPIQTIGLDVEPAATAAARDRRRFATVTWTGITLWRVVPR